jgi:hypothetical protein
MAVGFIYPSFNYLRFEHVETHEVQAHLLEGLQAHGIEPQRVAQVQHPDDMSRQAFVLITQSLSGEALARALAALAASPGGSSPLAHWRVEDMV